MIVKDFRPWYAPCRYGRGAARYTDFPAGEELGKPTPDNGGGGESTDGASQWLVIPPDGGSGWIGDGIRLHRPRGYYGALATDARGNESSGRLSSRAGSKYRADCDAATSDNFSARGSGRGARRRDEANCLPTGQSDWHTEKIVRADIELNPIERRSGSSGKQHGRHVATQQRRSLPRFRARLALSLCPIASLVGHFFRL
jgi:hypothetical protein